MQRDLEKEKNDAKMEQEGSGGERDGLGTKNRGNWEIDI